MTNLVAYHNDPEIKHDLITNLLDHAEHDRIVHGHYWQKGKGCAIACTLRSVGESGAGEHEKYETKLGIPQVLAYLEDRIFEGLPNAKAKDFPIKFAAAIRPGADLSMVWPRFAYWLLTEEVTRNVDRVTHRKQWIAVETVANLYCKLVETGKPISWSAAESAANAAESAVNAAWSAAWSAAESAAWGAVNAAKSAAAYAAESAAWSAESAESAASAASAAWSAAASAAWSAESAAWSAESAAWSAESAAWSAAKSAAKSAAYTRQADKLIELLSGAP